MYVEIKNTAPGYHTLTNNKDYVCQATPTGCHLSQHELTQGSKKHASHSTRSMAPRELKVQCIMIEHIVMH